MGVSVTLAFQAGPKAGETVQLSSPVTLLGRVSGEIVIAGDGSMSGKHAEIQINGDIVAVFDQKSTNGTWVNGNRVTFSALEDGDILVLGDTEIRVKIGVAEKRTRGGAPPDRRDPPPTGRVSLLQSILEGGAADKSPVSAESERITAKASIHRMPPVEPEPPAAAKTPLPVVAKTPPPPVAQTPPSLVAKTPPSQIAKTPPPQVVKTPPSLVAKTPPPQVTKTPPLPATNTPHPLVAKSPPPQVTKTPPPSVVKPPPLVPASPPVAKARPPEAAVPPASPPVQRPTRVKPHVSMKKLMELLAELGFSDRIEPERGVREGSPKRSTWLDPEVIEQRVKEVGQTLPPLARTLGFFQLVRQLERAFPSKARAGGRGPASDEVVRFQPDVSLAFPISDVVSAERVEGRNPRFLVRTSFFGLYGTTSPLPSFYGEEVLWRQNDDSGDPVRAFLDVFHHRLISLYYRSWTKYRYPVQFEPDGRDAFSLRMLSLLGLGTARQREGLDFPAERLIRYLGVWTRRPHSASALEGALRDLLGVPVEIEQCVGSWVPIVPDQRASLGRANCKLGSDCTIGQAVFSRNGRFRIAAGPMDFPVFADLLNPVGGTSRISAIDSVARLFARDFLDFDVKLLVRGTEIPRTRLASNSAGRLGWTTFLSSTAAGGKSSAVESVLLSRSTIDDLVKEAKGAS